MWYDESIKSNYGGTAMKLGAQLFSLRSHLKTEEDLRRTFLRVKEIGYENVQLSGAAPMPADFLKAVSEESSLPIVCTHSAFERIVNETDELIREHLTFGCPVIGLGAMPKEYRNSREGLHTLTALLETPVKKILDAGLRFAYHNHAFELAPVDGTILFDEMLETLPDWQFILDTYWVEFAGFRAVDYIRRVGSGRLTDIHYKDMANNEKRSICACGDGVLDFSEITAVCREIGVRNALVEQDNAVDAPDPFDEMRRSFDHLRPIVH